MSKVVSKTLVGKTALVVGGTNGIGAAICAMLARHGCARVIIGGRNEAAAEAVISRMHKAYVSDRNQQPNFSFAKVDMSLMQDVRRFCHFVIDQLNGVGLDLCIVTAGGLYFGPRIETSEGNEKFVATNYLSRFLLFHLLLPSVRRAGEGRAMISILSAGKGRVLNLEDPQATVGAREVSLVNGALNDFLVKSLAERHARDGIRFVHAWPGFVSTGAWTDAKAAGVPNWVVCLLYPLRLTMITPDSYAEKVVHDVILANVGHPKDSIPRSKTGAQDSTWEWLGQYGEVLKGSKWMIANLDKGARVYEWSRNLVKDFLPGPGGPPPQSA